MNSGAKKKFALKLSHKGMLIAFLPLIILLVFAPCLFWLVIQAERAAESEYRARAIYQDAGEVVRTIIEALGHLTLSQTMRDPDGLKAFRERMQACQRRLDGMRKRCGENKRLIASVDELESFKKELSDMGEETREIDQFGGRHAMPLHLMEIKGRSMDVLRGLRASSANMRAELDKQVSVSFEQSKMYRSLLLAILAGGIAIAAVISVLIVVFMHKNIIRRIEIILENSKRLAEDQPLLPMTAGGDEIASVDQSFRAMAASLEEARLRERSLLHRITLMMEQMPAGLLVLDESGFVVEHNSRTYQLLQMDDAPLDGRHFTSIMANNEDRDPQAEFQKLLRRSLGHISDITILTGAGKELRMELSLDELEIENRKQYLAILLDISERFEYEKMKRELISMVAHDIRSPLTAIQSTLTLVSNGLWGKLSDHGNQRIEKTERETQRLIRMFNDLLQIQKFDARQLEITPSDSQAATMVHEAVDTVNDAAEAKSIEIVFDTVEQIIRADRDRIIQVLFNLLSNAIKYSPENSFITVSIAREPNQLRFSVIDNGSGIPPGKEEDIFSAFKQSDHKDATVKGGTGLGLAICRSIVQAHAGDIGAFNNKESPGATFWFVLPT